MSVLKVDTIKNIVESKTIAVNNLVDGGVLAGQTGAGLVGYKANGTGSVTRSVANKLGETVSVKDFGAVGDGVTDDTAAIQAARSNASIGGSIIYGGKFYSPNYFGNLAPLAQEWIHGTPDNYSSDQQPTKPITWAKNYVSTPMTGPGYVHYASAWDSYTKPDIDVQSGATAVFRMNSYSTNSLGNSFNNTYQTALVANSSALSSTASASVEAINAIAESLYTGIKPQMVVGVEVDISTSNPPGFFGDTNKAYSVGVSSNWTTNSQHGTVAFSAGTSFANKSWRHGLITSGTVDTGVTVTRNGALSPTIGAWIASATTYGVYVGSKPLTEMNPGCGGDYTYSPAIGIGLGQTGATSSNSHKLRFVSTNGASNEVNLDVYTTLTGELLFNIDGTNKYSFAPNGHFLIQGVQVIGTRVSGYSAIAGAINRGSVYNTSTITLSQLAERVAAIQQDLSSHGLIG